MLGHIMTLPQKDHPGEIYASDNKIYYYNTVDCNENIYLDTGIEVEFAPLKEISNYHLKKIKLVSITKSLEKPLETEINNIFITHEKQPTTLKVIESVKSFLAYGEAPTKSEALEKLASVAEECGANTILKTKLSIIYNNSKTPAIFKYSGFLANSIPFSQKDNEDEEITHDINNQQNQTSKSSNHSSDNELLKPITIDKKLIMHLSPNLSTKIKTHFALILFLLFFIPAWGQVLYKYSSVIPTETAILVGSVICISVILIYRHFTPSKPCGYLLKIKKN